DGQVAQVRRVGQSQSTRVPDPAPGQREATQGPQAGAARDRNCYVGSAVVPNSGCAVDAPAPQIQDLQSREWPAGQQCQDHIFHAIPAAEAESADPAGAGEDCEKTDVASGHLRKLDLFQWGRVEKAVTVEEEVLDPAGGLGDHSAAEPEV